VERFQREFVQRALERTSGNVSQAAETCGMTRVALQKILRQLAIDRATFAREDAANA
jgi:ActR/RegA family two-component response regulator